MRRKALRAALSTQRSHNTVIADALITACQTRDRALADLAIAEDALEAERQWRLTSLPALLAAEERAVKAEARVAYLEDRLSPPRAFPELRPPRIPSAAAVRAAFHQSTNEERP